MALDSRQILDLNAFKPGATGLADPAPQALVERWLGNLDPVSVLFYAEPLHIVRVDGASLHAADGRRYLDISNNVPSVGHYHPRVVAVIARQAGILNVHTRYLNELTETYAERLKATLPAGLETLAFLCSGSEANDLALRLARHATCRGGFLVTTAAYHGNTAAATEISPAAHEVGGPSSHVRLVPPPGPEHYGANVAAGFAAAVRDAIEGLTATGHGFAVLICDSIFSSDGIYADSPGLLREAASVVRAAAGLWIADEVQPGFARTGDAFWGFTRHGVQPDIVTMRKPMGNGFPMAGLASRPDVLAPYFVAFGYFNTFGGNPVAAAAGLAVLDVILDEDLEAHAGSTGRHLRERLDALAGGRPSITAVRGAGLFIGTAGLDGNVLKIRRPLCFAIEHADRLVEALADVLPA